MFWQQVDVKGEYDCWPWLGTRTSGKAFYRWNGNRVPPYVVVFDLLHGSRPGHIPRFCKMDECTNPRHMESEEYVRKIPEHYFYGDGKTGCVIAGCDRLSQKPDGMCTAHQQHFQGTSRVATEENGCIIKGCNRIGKGPESLCFPHQEHFYNLFK